MNDLIPVEVSCHSGFRADEYPEYFYWNGIKFEIAQILDRWYQGDLNPSFPKASYFKVVARDGKIYLLKHEIYRDQWFLFIHGESLNL